MAATRESQSDVLRASEDNGAWCSNVHRVSVLFYKHEVSQAPACFITIPNASVANVDQYLKMFEHLFQLPHAIFPIVFGSLEPFNTITNMKEMALWPRKPFSGDTSSLRSKKSFTVIHKLGAGFLASGRCCLL